MLALGWQAERYRSVAVPTLLLVGALTESHISPPPTRCERPSLMPRWPLDSQRHMAAAFDAAGFATAVLGAVLCDEAAAAVCAVDRAWRPHPVCTRPAPDLDDRPRNRRTAPARRIGT